MTRDWSEDELAVLAAIYFEASFSMGDDARDECRTIAACFGRSASAIDRQWRNMDAVARNKTGLNIGKLVKKAVHDFISNPDAYRRLAMHVCERNGWPLTDLVLEGRQSPSNRPVLEQMDDGLRARLCEFAEGVEFKLFPAGSQGFARQGDVEFGGALYRVHVSAVAMGTRQVPGVLVQSKPGHVAQALGPVVAQVQPRAFGAGRLGFYGAGRASIGSETYKVTVSAVELGQENA